MGLSSAGVGSGLDVSSLVQSLMKAEQKPLDTLNTKKADYNAKLSAFGSIKSNLSQFQTTLRALSDGKGFQSLTASSSENISLTSKLSGNALPANYNIEVNQLAQSQKIVSSGKNGINDVLGTGTIRFDFGTIQGGTTTDGKYTGAAFVNNSLPSKTVTIDSSNNTLSGIRDAINSANIGVSASIINDGTNTPYRLLLSNSQTGETQSMKIAVSGDATLSDFLNYDPTNNAGQALTELTKAQNAKLKIDGFAITKSSNTIDDVITGVTLSLQKINTGSPTNLNIARNTDTLSTNLQNLVKGYNSLISSISTLTTYDTNTQKGATLYGESSLRSIKNQIRSTLSSALPNGSTGFKMLNQIGISFQKEGTLTLDSTKLQTAIDSAYDQIASLFTATGNSTDSQIKYVSTSSATKTGSYAVNISQMASQGSLSGQSAAGLNITANINDSLSVNLNGISSSIKLTAGSYTASGLAAEIQSRINANSSFANFGLSVAVNASNDGKINLVSNYFGSTSSINLSGNAAETILGGNGVAQSGLNMIGSINGKTVTSSGQYLIGATGDDSEGLTIKMIGGGIGNRGTVNYTQGIAVQVNQLIDSFTASNGLITTRTDGINASIKKLGDDITRTQDRLTVLQKRYEAQFNSLDTIMSKMTSTSSYLTQQLTSLSKSN